MKKPFLLLLISFISFSQSNKFKKGYYINNQEIKTECYILDNDWSFNPNNFDVKKTLSETPYNITIDDVKEFSIYDESKYIRENVDIDISPTDRESLSKNKNPEFKNKIVFLKVLVEGNNNLFSFESAQIPKRFFFQHNRQS